MRESFVEAPEENESCPSLPAFEVRVIMFLQLLGEHAFLFDSLNWPLPLRDE